MTAKNTLSNDTFGLKISFINHEKALDSYQYFGMLFGLILILLALQNVMKRQVKKKIDEEDKKEKVKQAIENSSVGARLGTISTRIEGFSTL
jgi:arginine exporter protein ArgO